MEDLKEPIATASATTVTMLSSVDQAALMLSNARHFNMHDKKNPQDGLADIVHTFKNIWPRGSLGKHMRQKVSRPFLHGVEIRHLEEPHICAGQLGLFTVTPFAMFDIVGEYTGEVTGEQHGGEYVARLEHKADGHESCIGVDAATKGSECRFINHYKSVGAAPNCILKIAYVEELPHIMVICTRNIAAGEELLLDYGDAYWDADETYLKAATIRHPMVSWNEMAGGDGCYSDEENEEGTELKQD